MKQKVFFLAILLVALLSPKQMMADNGYDFVYTYQGKTLYYSIIQNGTMSNAVKVVNPYGVSGADFSYISGDIVIPDTVENNGIRYAVKEIEQYAFSHCSITSISIPNSVISFGTDVFGDCTNLESVTIPNHFTEIPDGTFIRCPSLSSVTIPDSVTRIGHWAFSQCTTLTNITIPDNVTFIGNSAFWGCNINVYCKPVTPPVLGDDYVFWSGLIFVPCGSGSSYQNASRWNSYSSVIHEYPFHLDYSVNITSNNDTVEFLMVGRIDCDSNVYVQTYPSSDNGYRFVGWSDGVLDPYRTIHLVSDTTIVALFDYVPFIISGTPYVEGTGTVTGSDTVHLGDTVTLTATPNYGYHFSHWISSIGYHFDNPLSVVANYVSFPYSDDQYSQYNEVFDPNPYTISLGVDSYFHGSVSGAGTFDYLDTLTVTATANYGYHFTQWDDGNTDNPRTITLTQDTSFTALFAKNTYVVTVLSNDSTIGQVAGSTACEYLDTVSVSAVAIMPHYHFVRWSDGGTDPVRNVVVTCDSVLTAIFAIDSHFVSVTANNGQYGSTIGSGVYPYGSTATIEAVAVPGYHFVEWNNGSRENPDTVTVWSDTAFVATFIDDVVTQICMVNVLNNHNVVMWEKDLPVQNYRIYRESNVTGVYELVATLPYDSMSVWVDEDSRPMSRSYRYYMTATDLYGYESEPGEVHKTMHLTINQGIGGRWNLVWTEYEGADFVTYMIYRGTKWSNMQLIDQMPAGGNTTYTDENAPNGYIYYQVVVVKATPCNATKSESLIHSNIATNGTVGIMDAVDNDIVVYSNDGYIVVDGCEGEVVTLYDLNGRQLVVQANGLRPARLAVPASGAYIVKVGNKPARKVVVIR